MFIKFNEEAQKTIKKAKVEMQNLKHAFVGSEHLILSILSSDNYVSNKLNEYGIYYDNFKDELVKCIGMGKTVNNYFIYTPLLKRVLENAIIEAKENNMNEVTLETIFLSILDEGEGVAIRILNNLGVNVDEMYTSFNNKTVSKGKSQRKLSFYEFGTDLTKKAIEGKIDPLIGRNKEVEKMIEILSRRNKNNPLLIGEAGVGKTAIVEELANRIVNNQVPLDLRKYKLISLSMASLVAGTKYRGEFEERITKILRELENNDNTIVFIDEIHTIVGAGGAEGAIDASNIIKPALARGKIKLIGATTISEYKDTIEKDKALNRRFQTIMVDETNVKETENILNNIKYLYENFHHVKIDSDVIHKLVLLTDKYMYDKKNPDKSMDVLDEVCAKVSLMRDNNVTKLDQMKKDLENIKNRKNKLIIGHKFNEASLLKNSELELESKINKFVLNNKNKNVIKSITINDVSKVLKEKCRVPIYEIEKDYDKLLKLEDYLCNQVIGQNDVIQKLVRVTKKIRLGYQNNNVPYSFLFVGSSGVGKTYLVKEYSKYLDIPLIRLDMSEFKENHSVSKIIGSPPGYVGYDDSNNVLEQVRNNPFSIILLDEIEKASNDVINLFLQILDEGIITDSKGNKVSFQNTIIIMTSNIASEKNAIGFNENNHELVNECIKETLSTIFVNRINTICYFNRLSEDNINKIVNKKIKEIKDKFKENDIKVTINKNVINEIIKEADYNTFGARKLNKLLEDKIDNIVIDGILEGKKKIVVNN